MERTLFGVSILIEDIESSINNMYVWFESRLEDGHVLPTIDLPDDDEFNRVLRALADHDSDIVTEEVLQLSTLVSLVEHDDPMMTIEDLIKCSSLAKYIRKTFNDRDQRVSSVVGAPENKTELSSKKEWHAASHRQSHLRV